MASNGKPYLLAAILDKLARQIAGAARIAQKSVVRIGGQGSHAEIFSQCDALLALLKTAINSLPAEGALEARRAQDAAKQDRNHSAAVSSGTDSCERWPSFAEALKEHLSEQASSASCCEAHLGEVDVPSLVEDRLDCIRPVLDAEIRHALGLTKSPVKHPQRLRRNVAGHARGPHAARRISTLDLKELRSAQKTCKLSDPMNFHSLAQRVDAIESELVLLRSAAKEVGTKCSAVTADCVKPTADAVPVTDHFFIGSDTASAQEHLREDQDCDDEDPVAAHLTHDHDARNQAISASEHTAISACEQEIRNTNELKPRWADCATSNVDGEDNIKAPPWCPQPPGDEDDDDDRAHGDAEAGNASCDFLEAGVGLPEGKTQDPLRREVKPKNSGGWSPQGGKLPDDDNDDVDEDAVEASNNELSRGACTALRRLPTSSTTTAAASQRDAAQSTCGRDEPSTEDAACKISFADEAVASSASDLSPWQLLVARGVSCVGTCNPERMQQLRNDIVDFVIDHPSRMDSCKQLIAALKQT